MRYLFLPFPFIFFCLLAGCGQKKSPPKHFVADRNDSICRYGKKYARPQRTVVRFPAAYLSESYKIRELRKAVPVPSNEGDPESMCLYDYYFVDNIVDYDEKGDSTFIPPGDKVRYKLKDLFFFDVNGDGLLDFIHYPKYYRALAFDVEFYDVFIKKPDGNYKLIRFGGYIVSAEFGRDSSLLALKTYQGICCGGDLSFFRTYEFDTIMNDLVLRSEEKVLGCQLR
jgi:hypothetical protein